MSLRSRLVIFLLAHRHWLRGQRRRAVVDEHTDLAQLRARADRGARALGALPDGVEVQATDIAGCSAEWLRPRDASAGVLLYFHGGGYVMGSRRSHRAVVARIASGSGLAALLFEYRLAPEHPFPAALDDALRVYRALLADGVPPSRIVFAGDSAGGGLCMATLLALRDTGDPLPAAAAAMSPWLDLACSGASYALRDPVSPEGSWQTFGRYYAGEHSREHPLVSPLYGDLHGLPPLLLYVGDREVMLDDARDFARKAQTTSVQVRLEIGRGMVHCYPAFASAFPEARVAMDDICAFLALHAGS